MLSLRLPCEDKSVTLSYSLPCEDKSTLNQLNYRLSIEEEISDTEFEVTLRTYKSVILTLPGEDKSALNYRLSIKD